MFKLSWDRCWLLIGAECSGEELKSRLISAYSEPQRKYHTLQHLKECLAVFDRFVDLAQEKAEVEIALWFHDAIYDVKASDNERKSAEWAEIELTKAGVPLDRIKRIYNHILATRHSALPLGRDQKLLVDIDLSILGSEPDRFNEYERQVREEYSFVPDSIFHEKRREVLSRFLNRNQIYATPELWGQFEVRARENIKGSIEALSG
ncbi:MAG: N-methyl-D-aspartate receptor NMDAR2C subunit [Candidatus Thiodiazotropha sp.]